MEVGDAIRQDETSIVGGWQSFDADASNTFNGGANSAIAQDETQTYLCVGDGNNSARKTWVQRGPITNQGPWTQTLINGFTVRVARIYDDILYLLGTDSSNGAIYRSEDSGKTYEKVTINIIGSFTDLAVWKGKYYAALSNKLYSSTSIEGPYVEDNRFQSLRIRSISVTPWGMFFGVNGQGVNAYTSSVAQIKNDDTVEIIDVGFSGALKEVSYRDGLLAWSGFSGTTQQTGNAAYMWSTDGTTFETKVFSDWSYPGLGGITDAGTVASSGFPKNGSQTNNTIIEFDPVSQTITDTGILQPNGGASKLTYDGGALTFMFGRFSSLWSEGVLTPVGVVSSVDAAAKTITLFNNR